MATNSVRCAPTDREGHSQAARRPMRHLLRIVVAASAVFGVGSRLLQKSHEFSQLTVSSATAPTIRFAAPELVDDSGLAHPPVPPGTGVPENFHTVGKRWLVGRLGPSPLGWAVPAPASQLQRWAVGGTGGEGFVSNMRAPANASTAAGLAAVRAATYYVQLAGGDVRYASSVGSSWNGDARWHIPDFSATNLSADGWSSCGAITLSVGTRSELTQTVEKNIEWRWHGIPAPGMNVTASYQWVAPRIYRVLPLPQGGYVAAVALVFNGQHIGKEGPELSICAFISSDGLDFQFSSVVVNASSGKFGPTEPDLAILADGMTLICVSRLDGDGACAGGSYRYYHQSFSTDGGVTWTAPTPIDHAGCARPRVLSLGRGAPLLLSGGRNCVDNERDISIWLNPDGMAGRGANRWVRYSLTAEHNRLWKGDRNLLYPPVVNSTTSAGADTTLSYTSLLATGNNTGVVFYNRYLGRIFSRSISFAMRFTVVHNDDESRQPAIKTDDGGHAFFQLMCCRIGGAHFSPGDDVKLAKFDIVLTANEFWKDLAHDTANSTWEAVRKINPHTQFFAYRDSMACDNEDNNVLPDVNNVARWNVSRGLKQGSLNLDNPQLFLNDSKGNRIYVASYNHTFLMDFGSVGWRQYFTDATIADNFRQPWSTQGQYIDNVDSTIITPTKTDPTRHSNGFSCFEPGCPLKYGSARTWSMAMNGFANVVADAFAKAGMPTLANRGLTSHPDGVAAWVALDRSVAAGHAPVGQLEEGAFVTPWFSPPACVDFLPLAEWQSQISVMGLIKHSKVMMLGHSKLASQKTAWANSSGVDNWKKPVHFWDIFYYCLASFSIGKNDVDNTAYFAFSEAYPMKDPYQNINWYDEYKLLDLGVATATLTNRTVGSASVYMREFEKGWVLVNPTDGYTNASDARNVTLPGPGRVRTHKNLHEVAATLPIVHSIELLPAHRGLFVLKADGAPPMEADDKTNRYQKMAHGDAVVVALA